ncbi:MAG TPA: biotin--[acetyl-CoA-carboxylase] ligase [bacterium]|nr:biotin--[acetyl-CoA-carboxylase] ligase [bacterium]
MARPLDPVGLQRHLAEAGLPFTVSYHPSTPSTQGDARPLLQSHGAGTWVVVAGEQTRGQGRQGRRWFSNPGDLACSFTLPLELPPERWGKLVQLAGLATATALVQLSGLPARVKWPNDVFLEGAKVAGCLGEIVETAAGPAAILGIGVNLVADNIAEWVEAPIYPITSLGAHGVDLAAGDLLVAVAGILWKRRDWPMPQFDEAFLAWWREYSLTQGQRVRVAQPDGTVLEGESVALDPTGALLVRDATGTVHRVFTGDLNVAMQGTP